MSTPNPGFQDIDLSQARQAYDAGDFATASREATRLMQQHPGDYRVLEFAAAVALVERRFQDSEQLLNRALGATTRPQEEAVVWSALGRLGRAVNNLDSAEESYRRAMLLDPAQLEHTLEFAYILATRGKLDPAIDVLRGAIARHPRDPQPCLALGNILTRANRQRDALAFYDMALQRDPNLAAAHFNAGVALTMLGKLDAAKTACETGLKLDPGLPGYYHLASLGALKPEDAAVAHLEELLRTPTAPAEARIDAGYALARVYDDAGDAARAFPPLKQASAMKRATLSYDIANDEDRTDKVIAFFTRDFFERYKGVSDSKLAPIFILGMPRSGTTLVEQMLAGHSQVQGGGELPYMMEIAKRLGDTWGSRGAAAPGSADEVRADLRAAVESYTRQTAQLHARRPRFTDKLPGNFLFIGLIHLMFPEARIIHCRRDPVDTCLSCYQRLFSSDVPYSYDLTELGRYHRLYQRLMDHWRAVLPPGRILDVDYESVVAEPEQEVRRMLDFCGLPYEPGCLEFQDATRPVVTASAVQVRQPLYKSSVRRWKKYGADLAPLLAALGMEAEA